MKIHRGGYAEYKLQMDADANRIRRCREETFLNNHRPKLSIMPYCTFRCIKIKGIKRKLCTSSSGLNSAGWTGGQCHCEVRQFYGVSGELSG